MKLHFLVAISLTALLFSCKQEPIVNNVVEIEQVETDIPDADLFNYDTLKGVYTGDFGNGDIRIILNYVSQKKAVGYNIHKGLQRNISGSVERNGDSILVKLAEPGDHEYDGVFEVLFMGADEHPKGSWQSNDASIPQKRFALNKIVHDDSYKELTNSNFTNYFGYAYDSKGNYRFEEDGFVLFSYYPQEDENRVDQIAEIKGTWHLLSSQLIIDWEANNVFPERKMSYEVRFNSEYEFESVLYREDDPIYQEGP